MRLSVMKNDFGEWRTLTVWRTPVGSPAFNAMDSFNLMSVKNDLDKRGILI
jgi:hypothetical protein